MLLLAPLVMTFVFGQRFPLFKIQVVKTSGGGIRIAVFAVAPQRMQGQMQRARHRLHGNDRFGWELAKRGKQRFADQLAHERGRSHGGGLVHEMSQRSAQVLFVEADRYDTARRSCDAVAAGPRRVVTPCVAPARTDAVSAPKRAVPVAEVDACAWEPCCAACSWESDGKADGSKESSAS